jgi:hypothetical protein
MRNQINIDEALDEVRSVAKTLIASLSTIFFRLWVSQSRIYLFVQTCSPRKLPTRTMTTTTPMM